MAGLIFLKECFDWINDEALNAYRYHMDVRYALNLEPVAQDISIRTLERYIARFEEDELAKAVMADVTVRLVELLVLKIDTQRLDSTHIFSDMASFGRTRLMGVAIKRFLKRVKQRRLAARRREQNTEVFRERYKIRAGIEGTNSGLKRKTGLGQLRVRRSPAVFHAILLKVAGWNMLRAASCAKMRQIVHERACQSIFGQILAILRSGISTQSVCIGRKTEITAYLQRYGELPPLHIAA